MSGLPYLAASVPLRLASAGVLAALPILAVQRLDDLALGGLLAGIALFPSVLSAPFVGAVLDRMRRPRDLLIVTGVATAGAYATAAHLGSIPTAVVVVVLAATALLSPVFLGGMSSFVTDGIPDARRAYAQDSLSYTISGIAGPAVAALVVQLADARIAMTTMAGIALAGTLGALVLVMHPRPRSDEHPLATIRAGLRHLVRHRPIALVTLSGTVAQIGGGATAVVAVTLSVQRFGTADAGAWIVTAFALGGLIGGLLVAARRWTRLDPVAVMGGGFVVVGGVIALAALDLGLWWTLGVMLVAGFFQAPANAAMLLLRNRESPLGVRSQVFTIGAGLRTASAAVGAAVAGVASGLDAALLLGGIAAAWVIGGLVLVGVPRDPHVAPEAEGLAPRPA